MNAVHEGDGSGLLFNLSAQMFGDALEEVALVVSTFRCHQAVMLAIITAGLREGDKRRAGARASWTVL